MIEGNCMVILVFLNFAPRRRISKLITNNDIIIANEASTALRPWSYAKADKAPVGRTEFMDFDCAHH